MENNMINELNDIFIDVKDEELTFENLPDGEYLATVTNAEYKLSKNNKPMVQFTFKVTEGELKDKFHNKFMMLSGKDESSLKANLSRYGTELKKYGIIATSLEDSFKQLKTIKGTTVKIKLSTNDGGYTNTSVELI